MYTEVCVVFYWKLNEYLFFIVLDFTAFGRGNTRKKKGPLYITYMLGDIVDGTMEFFVDIYVPSSIKNQ